MTVVPDVSPGTTNAQLNAPVVSVVRAPLVQFALVIAAPSKPNPTKLVTEKFVPETVTVAPVGPCPGVTVIAGVVTVKAVVAVRPEPASVAWIGCDPELAVGTVNVQTNPPVAVVVMVFLSPLSVPGEQLTNVSEPPANVTVTVPDAVNPVPVSVAELPTGPWPGATVTACGVTVNVCALVGVLVATSSPTTE